MLFGTVTLYRLGLTANSIVCRYCIPLDTSRPIHPAEREFLDQGTGKGKAPLHTDRCLLDHRRLCIKFL